MRRLLGPLIILLMLAGAVFFPDLDRVFNPAPGQNPPGSADPWPEPAEGDYSASPNGLVIVNDPVNDPLKTDSTYEIDPAETAQSRNDLVPPTDDESKKDNTSHEHLDEMAAEKPDSHRDEKPGNETGEIAGKDPQAQAEVDELVGEEFDSGHDHDGGELDRHTAGLEAQMLEIDPQALRYKQMEPHQPYQSPLNVPEAAVIEYRDKKYDVDDPPAGLDLSNEPALQETLGEELLTPDLITLPAYDLRLVHDPATSRKLLRFSNSIANLGPGTLELWGDFDGRSDTVAVSQRLYFSDGESVELRVGNFYYHDDHNHWHWDGFSLYEVYSVSADGTLIDNLYTSGKVGYCVRDDREVSGLWDEEIFGKPAPEAGDRTYFSCNWRKQGISPGWSDVYLYNTPGQFVELTGLDDGLYALRSVSDPYHRIFEIDKANNEAITYFRLEGLSVEVFDFDE
jgi:hypothetical protein